MIRQRAVDAALVDDSPEARLLHRYEMAHDRSLRSTINQLIALDKSGADLAGVEEDDEETAVALPVATDRPDAPTEPEAEDVAAPSEPEAGASAGSEAPSEPEDRAIPTPSGRSDGLPEGLTWPSGTPAGAGSRA